MYSTSTQKQNWTFKTVEELDEMRAKANEEYLSRLSAHEMPDNVILSSEDASLLLKVVTETALRFADGFKPPMFPSVRWTACAYFKRFYLRHSPMEFLPKLIATACYYLAAKVEEFNVSIDDFVQNLATGTRESNVEQILFWEPNLMVRLDYQLTVHGPFRAFEGHLIELKTHGMLGFDLEEIRPHSDNFFRNCLFGDVMFLHNPTQIALAALCYGLRKMGKMSDIFRQHVFRLCEVDSWKPTVESSTIADKLLVRVDEIIDLVEKQSQPFPADHRKELMEKLARFQAFIDENVPTAAQPQVPVDSDDD